MVRISKELDERIRELNDYCRKCRNTEKYNCEKCSINFTSRCYIERKIKNEVGV